MSEDRVSYSISSSPETFNGSPGSILRRCREFHGISLEEASEATKIGVSHLKALEYDQIKEFANQVYLKGFLRIYATFLGLNSDDIARMYDKLFGVKTEKTVPEYSAAAPVRLQRRMISFKKMLVPALLLGLILITSTFWGSPPSPVRQPQPAVAAAPPPQQAAIQPVQSSVRNSKAEQKLPLSRAEQSPVAQPNSEITAATKRPSETAEGFILKIKVTQNGTLTAVVDGSGPQLYELTFGDVIEWKAEKKVALELSNAGGVDVELNGKPYKALGLPGKQAYVEFDANGIKNN